MARKNISIIGSGVSSLAAAAFLAKEGHDVHIYEKNASPGGRARSYEAKGFRFDMGPSWFWMPDVFERFYDKFGKSLHEELQLKRLDPSYKVYFKLDAGDNIPAGLDAMTSYVENIEEGAGLQFLAFMKQAETNYNIAVKDVIYQPGISPLELVNSKTISRLPLFFKSIQKQIHSKFKSEKLRQLLCFPVLFLGARPQDMPAFYNFMNHADTVLGTWYPKGGFYALIQSMVNLCTELGVTFHYNCEIKAIHCNNKIVKSIEIGDHKIRTDILLSGADYAHTEQLLPETYRKYSDDYWEKRQFAPSSLIFYLGIDKKIPELKHHNLFFDTDFEQHTNEIYKNPKWPESPLFYVCNPSKTDPNVAPEGSENVFILIPLAAGLEDTEALRASKYEQVMSRLEKACNTDIRSHIVYKRSYCLNDFKEDYHACKGNAYGLANTFRQTAFLRPPLKSKKLNNMFFCGQLSVPGPGVPPSLISGELSARLINEQIIADEKVI